MGLFDSLAEIEPLYYGSIERIVIEVSHQYRLTPGVLSEKGVCHLAHGLGGYHTSPC